MPTERRHAATLACLLHRLHGPAASSAFVLSLVLALGRGADAAPAPWHVWRSKLDGREICHQTRLGPGWEWARGPFRDARCMNPARQVERPPPREQGVDKSQGRPRLPGRIPPID